jgi:hypothetical protein
MQEEEGTHDICHARIPRNFTSALSVPPLYFPVQADAQSNGSPRLMSIEQTDLNAGTAFPIAL